MGCVVHPSVQQDVVRYKNLWQQLGAVRQNQKIYFTAEDQIGISAGEAATSKGWFIQALARNLSASVYGVKANRQDTVQSLQNAKQASVTAVRKLVQVLDDPSCDLALFGKVIRTLNSLQQAIKKGAVGLEHLATTYQKDSETGKKIGSLRKEFLVFLRQVQQQQIVCRAELYARVNCNALRAFSQRAPEVNEGFMWVDATSHEERFLHTGRLSQMENESTTVGELLRGERINLALVPVEADGKVLQIPHQLAHDLPRLGTLSLQGEMIYDNANPTSYTLPSAYKRLRAQLGEKVVHRIASLMTQASLPELTVKATEIGGRHRPVIAIGGEQHMAIQIKNGAVSLAVTLPFNLQNQDNIEERVGEIQATRQIVIPLEVLQMEKEQDFQKSLSTVIVVDQYSNPRFIK